MALKDDAAVAGQSSEQPAKRKPFVPDSAVGQLGGLIRPLVGFILIAGALMLVAPTLRSVAAWEVILEQTTVMLIMATGTTVILISGNLDLSVGSILALVAVIVGDLLWRGLPPGVAVAAGLLAGALLGFINGVLVVGTGVPTLIVTLGTLMAYRGFANMHGMGKDMSRFPEAFSVLGHGLVGPLIITAIAVVVVWFILSKTRLGFSAYAQGGNAEVARLSGIPVKFNVVIFYVISGVAAALASIVQTSRLDFATPNRGQAMELWVIAATVIGGTSMFGGIGGVFGTVIGVLIIKTLEAGLIHAGVQSFWQQVAIGAVIIVAVWIDVLQRKRRQKV